MVERSGGLTAAMITAGVAGTTMGGGGALALVIGAFMGLAGGIGEDMGDRMVESELITHTTCDTCDYDIETEVGDYENGAPCPERNCSGRQIVETRIMTDEEMEKKRKEWEKFKGEVGAFAGFGRSLAYAGVALLVAGILAVIGAFGLHSKKRWGRTLAFIACAPAILTIPLAAIGSIGGALLMGFVPVVYVAVVSSTLLGEERSRELA